MYDGDVEEDLGVPRAAGRGAFQERLRVGVVAHQVLDPSQRVRHDWSRPNAERAPGKYQRLFRIVGVNSEVVGKVVQRQDVPRLGGHPETVARNRLVIGAPLFVEGREPYLNAGEARLAVRPAPPARS